MSRAARPTAPSRSTAARWARRQASRAMSSGLRAFYSADPRRGPSRERDFGLSWRSVHGTTYRAAWIADTEELYSVRYSGDTEDAEVTVLARLSADALERCLAGWRRICETGEPGSYEWLVERARAAWRSAAPAF